VISPAGAFGYAYTALDGNYSGRLVRELGLPRGATITNAYESVSQPLVTHLRTSAGVLTNKHEYLYNPAGQRTNETRVDASSVTYTYDPIGQLKVADSSVGAEDRGYAYDAAWNLNYRTNNGALGTFQVNVKNELTNAPSAQLTYDANGNALGGMGSGGGWGPVAEATYDDENRLISLLWTDLWRTHFTYDGLGRLRKRADYETYFDLGEWYYILNSETHYVYDGWRVIQERGDNNTPAVSYTRGNDLSGSLEAAGGIGGLLARSHGHSGGNWSIHNFYHADGNGNITFMLNSSQTMVARYRYDPFGNTISQSGALAGANMSRFSSKEIHPSSGLYYYGYRFYDPSLQRWMNRDPLEERYDLNLYRFCRNTPIQAVDTDGRHPVSYPIVIGERYIKDAWDCGWRIMDEEKKRPPNGKTDTWAHCVASCRISRECPGGRFSAWIGGDWINDPWWRNEKHGSDPRDRKANKIGRDLSRSGCDCVKACDEAWKDGRLQF